MPRELNGKKYYNATEICRMVGISRPTLFRWLKRGILSTIYRDRRGWRLFMEEDLIKMKSEAGKIRIEYLEDSKKREID